MKVSATNKQLLLKVLKELDTRCQDSLNCSEICDLAETVASQKEALKIDALSESSSTTLANAEKQSHEEGEISTDTKELVDSNERDDDKDVDDDESSDDEIMRICNRVLESISSKVIEAREKFTASHIRRLLVVYSLLPFRADELIEALDTEVTERLSYIHETERTSIEVILEESNETSLAINRTLFQETSHSPFEAIKNGLMSIFSSSSSSSSSAGDGTNESDEGNVLTDELAHLIQSSVALTTDVTRIAKAWKMGSRRSLDSMLNSVDVGSAFELGRCQELIENYQLIEFSTGMLGSRVDERRNDIAKRVLSRLLP